jgi:putative transposase
LRHVPRHDFDRLAKEHHAGAPLRSIDRWSQFAALATAHLACRHSLRDVVANLAAQSPRLYHLGVRPVARSSLSRVNAEQPYTLYEALFAELYQRCRRLAPRHGFRFKNKLYSLDSSLIDLSLAVFPWAHYALGKAAMKLHVGLDHDGFLPAFAAVTESKVNDLAYARSLRLARGSIVVFDKGYSDYAWLKALDDAGVFFVTRARANIDATAVEERTPPRGSGVTSDRSVRLDGKRPQAMNMPGLRAIGFTCPETGRNYVFLTNIFHLSARTIADLYKQRWQVELFFKWLKQNLELTHFLGTSRNAVTIQIMAALIVFLLLRRASLHHRTAIGLQAVARLLPATLLSRRPLATLLKPPDLTPHQHLNQTQLEIAYA